MIKGIDDSSRKRGAGGLENAEIKGDHETEPDLEAERRFQNQRRQQRKLAAVFLTDDLNYLNLPDVELYEGAENKVLEKISRGEVDDRRAMDVISNIRGPENVQKYEEFLRDFPTPFNFEDERKRLEESGTMGARQLDAFSRRVYGKRWEYYLAYKAMVDAAEAKMQEINEPNDVEPGITRRRLRRRRSVERERGRERLIEAAGVYDLSKGFLRGEANPRPSQDANYVNEEEGTFAVFDGAGGHASGREASQAALRKIKSFLEGNPRERIKPESEGQMVNMMDEINKGVLREGAGGFTTGVVAQIVENGGRKQMIYGSVGDSRIYVVRENHARQVTEDEGAGNMIWNCFGIEDYKLKQVGKFDLFPGDTVILCSDGITGDFAPDLISDRDVATVAQTGKHPQEIARELVLDVASKDDDRTAVVIRV